MSYLLYAIWAAYGLLYLAAVHYAACDLLQRWKARR